VLSILIAAALLAVAAQQDIVILEAGLAVSR
jgi:hypothetical protein